MEDLTRFILVTMIVAILLWISIAISVRAVRWARKGSSVATFIGWAMLLPTAGMNPQPPPQEQVEEANRQKRIKKPSESGDPPANVGASPSGSEDSTT